MTKRDKYFAIVILTFAALVLLLVAPGVDHAMASDLAVGSSTTAS